MVRWTEEDLAIFKANSGRPMARAAIDEIAKHKAIAKLEAKGREQVRTGKVAVKRAQPGAGANKYRAKPVVLDGIRFDSKLEARRYDELRLEQLAGKVLYFLRQVPFHLPGGVIYRADFLVVRPSRHTVSMVPSAGEKRPQFDPGSPLLIDVEDCKGFQRQDSKNKIKQVRDLYGVEVVLVKRAARGRV